MKRKLPLLFTLAASLVTFPLFADAQVKIGPGSTIRVGSGGKGWTITSTDPIEIRRGGEVVAVYQTGKSVPKPFFYPVIGPTGENITRHWPMKEGVEGEATDHIHHRGIWFGLGKVNGIDFWHEGGKKDRPAGVMVHTGLKGIQMSGDSLTFKTTTDWVTGDDGLKICQDHREFRLASRENDQWILDATITIEASDGDVTIKDDKEGSFAIRVIPSLRSKPAKKDAKATGTTLNSNGQKNDEAWGKRAKWVSYFGPDKEGRPVGVSFFDHPSNLRHPSWWHARNYGLFAVNPFGQGHFEKDAEDDAGDYTIKHGDSLTLRYRLFFHHGTPQDAKVEEEYEAFVNE